MNPARLPTVYVADTLPPRYPGVWAALRQVLATAAVETAVLPGTRDVWVRDYLPVALPSGGLQQFRYAPDYLQTKRGQRSITNAAGICAGRGWQPQYSNFVLDGGNVVRCGNRVLLTDKVLRANPAVAPRQLVRQLAGELEAESLVLLPADPHDFTGHADGMLHPLDERTVLVNDYRREKWWPTLQTTLLNAGLEWEFLPYNPYGNASYDNATGCYCNFLCLRSIMLVPVFGLLEDEPALRQLERLFPRHTVVPVAAQELAPAGGLLHCVTWEY